VARLAGAPRGLISASANLEGSTARHPPGRRSAWIHPTCFDPGPGRGSFPFTFPSASMKAEFGSEGGDALDPAEAFQDNGQRPDRWASVADV